MSEHRGDRGDEAAAFQHRLRSVDLRRRARRERVYLAIFGGFGLVLLLLYGLSYWVFHDVDQWTSPRPTMPAPPPPTR